MRNRAHSARDYHARNDLLVRDLIALHEGRDMFIEKFLVRGARASSGGMPPERWYWQKGAVRNERRFVAGIGNWKIEIGGRRHVKHLRFDRPQRLLQVS